MAEFVFRLVLVLVSVWVWAPLLSAKDPDLQDDWGSHSPDLGQNWGSHSPDLGQNWGSHSPDLGQNWGSLSAAELDPDWQREKPVLQSKLKFQLPSWIQEGARTLPSVPAAPSGGFFVMPSKTPPPQGRPGSGPAPGDPFKRFMYSMFQSLPSNKPPGTHGFHGAYDPWQSPGQSGRTTPKPPCCDRHDAHVPVAPGQDPNKKHDNHPASAYHTWGSQPLSRESSPPLRPLNPQGSSNNPNANFEYRKWWLQHYGGQSSNPGSQESARQTPPPKSQLPPGDQSWSYNWQSLPAPNSGSGQSGGPAPPGPSNSPAANHRYNTWAFGGAGNLNAGQQPGYSGGGSGPWFGLQGSSHKPTEPPSSSFVPPAWIVKLQNYQSGQNPKTDYKLPSRNKEQGTSGKNPNVPAGYQAWLSSLQSSGSSSNAGKEKPGQSVSWVSSGQSQNQPSTFSKQYLFKPQTGGNPSGPQQSGQWSGQPSKPKESPILFPYKHQPWITPPPSVFQPLGLESHDPNSHLIYQGSGSQHPNFQSGHFEERQDNRGQSSKPPTSDKALTNAGYPTWSFGNPNFPTGQGQVHAQNGGQQSGSSGKPWIYSQSPNKPSKPKQPGSSNQQTTDNGDYNSGFQPWKPTLPKYPDMKPSEPSSRYQTGQSSQGNSGQTSNTNEPASSNEYNIRYQEWGQTGQMNVQNGGAQSGSRQSGNPSVLKPNVGFEIWQSQHQGQTGEDPNGKPQNGDPKEWFQFGPQNSGEQSGFQSANSQGSDERSQVWNGQVKPYFPFPGKEQSQDTSPKKPGQYPAVPPEKPGQYPAVPPKKLGQYPAVPPKKLGQYPAVPPKKLGQYPAVPPEKLGQYPVVPPNKPGQYPVVPPKKPGQYPAVPPKKPGQYPDEVPNQVWNGQVEPYYPFPGKEQSQDTSPKKPGPYPTIYPNKPGQYPAVPPKKPGQYPDEGPNQVWNSQVKPYFLFPGKEQSPDSSPKKTGQPSFFSPQTHPGFVNTGSSNSAESDPKYLLFGNNRFKPQVGESQGNAGVQTGQPPSHPHQKPPSPSNYGSNVGYGVWNSGVGSGNQAVNKPGQSGTDSQVRPDEKPASAAKVYVFSSKLIPAATTKPKYPSQTGPQKEHSTVGKPQKIPSPWFQGPGHKKQDSKDLSAISWIVDSNQPGHEEQTSPELSAVSWIVDSPGQRRGHEKQTSPGFKKEPSTVGKPQRMPGPWNQGPGHEKPNSQDLSAISWIVHSNQPGREEQTSPGLSAGSWTYGSSGPPGRENQPSGSSQSSRPVPRPGQFPPSGLHGPPASGFYIHPYAKFYGPPPKATP